VQRLGFARDGFLALEDTIAPDEAAALGRRAFELIDTFEPDGIGRALHDLDPVFDRFS
jgi:hypothetical protein